VTETHQDGASWRIAHLTTADISLALLLSTELDEGVKRGHQILGISAPGPYVERVEALGVRHVPVPTLTRSWRPLQDLRAFVALYRTLKTLNLDVLHTHNPKTGVMGRIAGRLARVPVVVNTCHGLWATPSDPLLKRLLVYGLEGLAIRFSDYELFQNAQDERSMRWALRPGRHKVVGNGIDLERFQFDPQGRAGLREQWGIAQDEILVGTVGRRVREKGLAEFSQAAEQLRDRARFVWVGPVDETDAVGDQFNTDSVLWVPEQTEMPAVHSAFDVFVLASYREGFSRAAMEAAACARPLILTDIRGCREIGSHDESVWLIPPGDAPALVEAIAHLLKSPAKRERLAAAVAARALATFDQRAIAAESLRTYSQYLEHPKAAQVGRQSNPSISAPYSDTASTPDQSPSRIWAIVITFRRPDVLERALKSLTGQTRSPDHIIVVDNDGDSRVRAISDEFSGHYLNPGDNLGPAGGISLAMEHVLARCGSHDWLLLVDDDDPPRDHTSVASLVAFAEDCLSADPMTGGVATAGSQYRRNTGTYRRIPDDELSGRVPLDVLFGGSTPLYRCSAVRAVGTFDTQLFWGFEEGEYGLRMKESGYSLYGDGDTWISHRRAMDAPPNPRSRPRTPLDKAAWRRYYSIRNSTVVARRYGRFWTVPYVALGGAAKSTYALLKMRRPRTELLLPGRGAWDGIAGRLGRTVDPGSNEKRSP